MAPPPAPRAVSWLRRSLVALLALALASAGFAHAPAGAPGSAAPAASGTAFADVLPEALASLCHGVATPDGLATAEHGPHDPATGAGVECPFCLLAKSIALPATLPSLLQRARRGVLLVVRRPRRLRAMSPRRAHRSRAPPRISIA